MYQFSAKTNQGTILKGLTEVLQNGMTGETFLCFDTKGITSRNMDNLKTRFVDIVLPMEQFDEYHCEEKRTVSLAIGHLLKIIKDVKKKDDITIFIEKKYPLKLKIKIINPSKQNDGEEIEGINIKDVILPEIEDIPATYYQQPRILEATKFLKICKKMINVKASDIDVTIQKNNYIKFYGDGGSIYTTEFIQGKLDDKKECYNEIFLRPSITDFMKLSSLGSNIQIFAPNAPDLPLKIKVIAGSLGHIEVFLRSKKAIQDAEIIEDVDIVSNVDHPKDEKKVKKAKESEPKVAKKVSKVKKQN